MEKKTRRTGGQSKPQDAVAKEVVMEAPKPQPKKQPTSFQ